jgi:hypothetical protein
LLLQCTLVQSMLLSMVPKACHRISGSWTKHAHLEMLLLHLQSIHVESKDRVLKQRARTKDSISERFPIGSCGVGNSGDRVALFSSRDPVTDSYCTARFASSEGLKFESLNINKKNESTFKIENPEKSHRPTMLICEEVGNHEKPCSRRNESSSLIKSC